MKYSELTGKLAGIFQAEVYAIKICTQFILDVGFNGGLIAILSESH